MKQLKEKYSVLALSNDRLVISPTHYDRVGFDYCMRSRRCGRKRARSRISDFNATGIAPNAVPNHGLKLPIAGVPPYPSIP
jgi:hypothetical protein